MLRASDLPPATRRQLTRRLSKQLEGCTVKHSISDNLSGSLFPTRNGVQMQPHAPLRVKRSALTGRQKWKEETHQMRFIHWVRRYERLYPCLGAPLGFHVANEFNDTQKVRKRNRKTGALYWYSPASAKRQAMGVQAGVPDWLNLRPGRPMAEAYSYLVIDFKVGRNDLTDEQRTFFMRALAAGASAHTVWAYPEAVLIQLWYFGLTTRELILAAGDPADYLVPRLGGHDDRCACGLKIIGSLRALLKLRG